MKILYLDLGMGAAGDMLSAALLELFPKEERQSVIDRLNSLGIPKVHFEAEPSVKCGITGTHMSVKVDGIEEGEEAHEHSHTHGHDHGCDEHDHHHEHEHIDANADECHHTHAHEISEHDAQDHMHEHSHGGHSHTHNSMTGIAHIINDHMQLDEKLRRDITEVYGLIAEAESHVHGVPVSEIHFHEVGNMDAVADVTAVSVMLSMLKPDRIVVSSVNTGSGKVKCAHGIMPVPAPATAYLLQGVPSYDNGIKGELLTPTGAALIRHFADAFGDRPAMTIERVGYGMGRKDFEAANCVRAILGESAELSSMAAGTRHDDTESLNIEPGRSDITEASDAAETPGTVLELSANIDDMSAEELGFAFDELLKAGALDVWTEPIFMKKQRQGVLLKVLCSEGMRETIVSAIFRFTSTIGVRETLMYRYILKREIREYDTKLGRIRAKHVTGYGVDRAKLEYDDLAAIADRQHISIARARELAEACIKQ